MSGGTMSKRRKPRTQIMYTVDDCGFRTDMFFNTKRIADLNRYGPEVVVKVKVTEILPRKRGGK